jgi:hypothetical protein
LPELESGANPRANSKYIQNNIATAAARAATEHADLHKIIIKC